MATVFCPQCDRPVPYPVDGELPRCFPFCSERCHLIDLGRWLDEEYRIDESLEGPVRVERGRRDAT